MSSNLATIRAVYEAFGRGDLPTILSHIAETVDWGINVDTTITPPEKVPYFRHSRTRDEVVKHYFAPALELFEFRSFVPQAFMEGDGHVSTLLNIDLTARRTARQFSIKEVHCFAFDETGRIKWYRGFLDTALIAAMNN